MATEITIGAAGGEYMETVVVTEWRVAVGEPVKAGDVLVVVETAKAATEVEASCDGVLTSILAATGEEVAVTAPLGVIGENDGIAARSSAVPASPTPMPGSIATPVSASTQPSRRDPSRVIASPVARRLAKAGGIPLSGIKGTGPNGRVMRRDVEAALAATHIPTQTEANQVPNEFAEETGFLNVVRSGRVQGEPIALIHGFGADANAWRELERYLEGDHPIIKIELPCHGNSPKGRHPGFAQIARKVRKTFDAEGLDRVHLVGHSVGGATALAIADVRGPKIKSLCLLAPAGLGPEIDGNFISGIARASRPESLGPWLRWMVHNPDLIADEFIRAAMALRNSETLRAAQLNMAEVLLPDSVQAIDLTAALKRPTAPAKIIWGRHDRIVPWRHALGAPGHVGLHLLPEVGHVPQLEAPAKVARLIQELIKSAA